MLDELKSKAQLGQALDQLRRVLQPLDLADAPADDGAHVDLAVCRLEETLGLGLHRASPSQMKH